jgi:hypothetical protein
LRTLSLEVIANFGEAGSIGVQTLAVAMGGFRPSVRNPANGWAASAGSHSMAVHGDGLVVV